jgi:plastocyanin
MRRIVMTICAALALANACSGGGSTAPSATNGNGTGTGTGTGTGSSQVPANTVIARAGLVFDPASLTISTNTTVSFTFESTGHNVTFDVVNGRPADIPGNNSNTTIARTFASPGSFTYHCTLHPGMNGTVIVQ